MCESRIVNFIEEFVCIRESVVYYIEDFVLLNQKIAFSSHVGRSPSCGDKNRVSTIGRSVLVYSSCLSTIAHCHNLL